ncbi:MAG: DUF4255 domain-containing protein [Bacteroidales bacterium]|nr:DUF4255 domain-containing protein [Bacteroidales bacterium]
MIYTALNIIGNKLNEYLKLKFKSNDNHLEMSNLVDQDGSIAITDTNKVIASLVNIERETSMGINPKMQYNSNGRHTMGKPPVFINVYLMFTSLFTGKNYLEGLKFISAIMEYLQGTPAIDHMNTPQLSDKIEKITFENVNLDIQDLSQLWGAIGGKYMPSVLYKIRMITIDQDKIDAEVQSVDTPDTKTTM